MQTDKNDLKRNQNVDFYKFVLILGVIWGHTITNYRIGEGQTSWLPTFFRTYDMPFFMIISGYFLHVSMGRNSSAEVLKKRVQGILIPLIFWQVILGVTGPLFESFRNLFSLWFLWALFGCTVYMIILCELIKSTYVQIGITIVTVILLHCLSFIPFNLGYMLPFFALGYFLPLVRKQLIELENNHIVMGSCMFIFILLQCFWSGQYNVWNAGTYLYPNPLYHLGIFIFRGAIGLLSCVCMKQVFDVLMKCLPTYIVSFAVKIGKNTMLLYILQSLIIERMLPYGVNKLKEVAGINYFAMNIRLLQNVIAPITAILVIIFLNYLIIMLQKNKTLSKFLCGKIK